MAVSKRKRVLANQKSCGLKPQAAKSNNGVAVPKAAKYIPRPVVLKNFEKINKESARSFKEELKELRLFSEFETNKSYIKFAQAQEKCKRLANEINKFWAINNVRLNSTTYAQSVKQGPINEFPIVYSCLITTKEARNDYFSSIKQRQKEKKNNDRLIQSIKSRMPIKLISDYNAKRDYVIYWKNVQKEKDEARRIVEAIAERHPIFKKRRDIIDSDNKTEKPRRKTKNKPIEVLEFEEGCYWEDPSRPEKQRNLQYHIDIVEKREPKPTSVKQIKTRWNRISKEIDRGDKPYLREFSNNRLNRRRLLVESLSKTENGKVLMAGYLSVLMKRNDCDLSQILSSFETLKDFIEPQMENIGAEGKQQQISDKSSTSIISSAQPEDKGKPHDIIEGFHKMAITKEIQQYSTVTSRWIPLDSFKWTVSHEVDTLVGNIYLPYNQLKQYDKSQNFQLFYTHRFMKPKVIRVKFVLNSNRFQIGCLVADVIYIGRKDKVSVMLQDNIYSALQRNHCKLMAGAGNNAELVIPYHWINSTMKIQKNINNVLISLRPLNKLSVAGNVATECNITAFMTFEDVELNGMISRELVPQMDSIANVINAGSNLISVLKSDGNRDNPPLPLNPISVIPQAMGSLAYTDFCTEPVYSLRADPRGQITQIMDNNEMSIEFLRDCWSFLKTYEWSTKQENRELFSIPVAPLLDLSLYPTAYSGKVPTALAMLGSLYGRWRGDIEFKFEVVMCSFYSGSFMVASVPLVGQYDKRTYQLASYSPYVTFDLSETGERIFVAPWNWYNSFANTRSSSIYDIPSYVKGYWVNPLIAIDNVPPSVYINVYVRGGRNFEVAIPRASILCPSFNDPIVPPKGQRPKPYNLESTWYLTYNSNVKSSSGKYPLVPYIQDVKNGFVGYTDLRPMQLYKLNDKTSKGLRFRCLYKFNSKDVVIQWGCYDIGLSTVNAHGLIVSWNKQEIIDYIEALKKGTSVEKARDVIKEAMWAGDGEWSQIYKNGKWIKASDDNDPPIWDWTNITIEPQMDNEANVVTRVDNPTITTTMGFEYFGEKTPDLKSLCRRWNHYGTIVGVVCSQGMPRDCPYSAVIRLNPIKHIDPQVSSSYDNRYRNGVITTIGSMYYLYRGGLRFRFIVVGNPPEGTMMYVSHRYDLFSKSFLPIVKGDGKVRSKDDMMNTQYATHGQALTVNSVFTVEVPYYNCQERLFTSFVEDPKYSDNGLLYVWIHSKVASNIHVEVYYSLADDSRFTVFQGVPICLDITNIEPEPQSDPRGIEIAYEATDDIPCTSQQAKNRGIFRTAKDFMAKQEEAAASVIDLTKDIKTTNNSLYLLIERIRNFVETSIGKLEASLSSSSKNIKDITDTSVSSILDYFKGLSSTVFSVVTHLIYSLISPCVSTIAWTLCNLYHVFFGFSLKGLDVVTEFVKSIWNRLKSSPTQLSQGEDIEPQSDFSAIGSYSSLLFSIITTVCSLKVTPPNSWQGIDKGLFRFGQTARASHFVGIFFEDNIKLFKRVFQKLLDMFGSKTSDFELLAGVNDERLRDWLAGATLLIAPQSSNNIENRQDWAYKVFEYTLVGRALVVSLCSEKLTPPKLLQAVQNIQKKLIDLERECINRKVFSPARYEPMCTWICGKGGRGKSRLLDAIVSEYAKENGVTDGQICHTITNGQKYFDGLTNQQIVVIDDFLSTSITVNPDILDLFLQFKSCIPLNPAYSKVEDKVNRVSFRDLIISSNRIWFSNDAGIDNPEAFNRRRDVMIRIEYSDPSMTPDKFKMLPLSSLENLDYVDIFFHISPGERSESGWMKIERENDKSYKEVVFSFLKQCHKNYHDKEQISYQKRCARMQDIINNCDNRGSFEVALKKYKVALSEAYSKNDSKPDFSPELDRWLRTSKNAATYSQDRRISDISFDSLQPQMDLGDFPNETGWPLIKMDSFEISEYSIGEVVEPGFVRTPKEIYCGNECKHVSFNFLGCTYDAKNQLFENNPLDLVNLDNNKSYCVRNGVCLEVAEVHGCKKLRPSKNCRWYENDFQENFFLNFHTYSEYSYILNRLKLEDDDSYNLILNELPIYTQNWILNIKQDNKIVVDRSSDRLIKSIKKIQKNIVDDSEVLGDNAIPKRSRWKTIPQKIWEVMIKAFQMIWKLLEWLLEFLGFIWKVAVVAGLIKFGWDTFSTRNLIPNLHASGDYKTLKSRGGVRSRALALALPHNEGIRTDDIIAICGSNSNKKGVINKIINNFFFLVGIKDTDNGTITYKARCLGLYNRTAICLKHYVEHWRAVGCEKVALVYNGAKGYVTYLIDELDFNWTTEGYGIVTFPKSLPRQFSKITQFIPSEKFDGNYPSDCIIVEPFVEDCYQYNIRISKITDKVKVPGTTTQSSWEITQGLSYDWGGRGRCGSFIIAPNMACPLIAIHTAGIGEKKGFGELLFKETFVHQDEPIFEFVEPNMIQDPPPYGLDGEYYCVGGLTEDKVPRNSTKTKIKPSLISGVFQVTTEPAPLVRTDPRLSEPLDIFRIGCSKRCEPIREFNKRDVYSTIVAYRDKMFNNVFSQRHCVDVLSIREAIEGFAIEGYDPIIMSTSEGYPWTLDRPSNSGSKAWLFNREEYPDGRMKIVGIYKPLLDVIDLKDKMRSQCIVPATYFTCCLKDARILKEKVSIPGKTRVFEMCPIELTIAQRQYFQDYVAGYIRARGNMEHTIGINPDGPEWSELANDLVQFSPFILTADYSGYGPHVSHTLLDAVFTHRMAWYDQYEDLSDEEKDRRFFVRSCIKEENMHGLHVVRDAVIRFASGLDSGNPSTVDLNSEVNSHLLRIAFLGLARKNNIKHCLDLYFFEKYVKIRHNGDDLIAAVKPEIISWFNNESLISFFADYGLKMTDALKEGKVRPYCSIEEASYLKRGFLKHPTRDGEWLAPLEKASITDTANWIWQSVNDEHASLINSEMCSRLAYSRGPEFYYEVSNKLKKAWKLKNINFEFPKWSTLDSHIWEGTPGPKYNF
ncbi:hypothetical protein [Wuhan insect virus 13]|uniref:hypothetical protein n=1 Tax=Wuhan insect virus 13 TaxID=1923717 RepID=UPI00090A8681|nr:hypothetical protein [Wuhan insect virus 13]APG78984.1 hypothetical protein [Wuhan insect virus 13]